MPEIHFYHNHPNPLAATCQLVGRAYKRGRKVLILTPSPAMARSVDECLWTFDQQSFVPHVSAESSLAPDTPVLITTPPQKGSRPHYDMLLNLGAPIPEDVAQFAMVLEVVGPEEEQRSAARQRWQDYRARGYTPVPHDMENGR